MQWEYKRHVKNYVESGYEEEMKKNHWIWEGNCMTADGMLYLWKRNTKYSKYAMGI